MQPMLDAAAEMDVPGAPSRKRAPARTRCVALCPTGRSWAAATTEGVVLYSLDDDMVRMYCRVYWLRLFRDLGKRVSFPSSLDAHLRWVALSDLYHR